LTITPPPTTWRGRLDLRYRRDGARTVAHDRHEGPLRVLASLYPEAPSVCHHVLVHPPGGIVGGDTLQVDTELATGAHALITTPGATRFYRSAGATATQTVHARVADASRLEWLPLETIVYAGALAENSMSFELARGAEMIGWDVLALGLPASNEPFESRRGRYTQHLDLPGVWLERCRIDAADARLLDSPLAFAGRRVLATLWFAAGAPRPHERIDELLASAREAAGASTLAATCGASSAHAQSVVMRVLAPRVEPAMALLCETWARWRSLAWGMAACAPRVWRT
jgi:urease accessory protein